MLSPMNTSSTLIPVIVVSLVLGNICELGTEIINDINTHTV